ncbi:MAG TPA: cytochrome c biogenesis protein CcsA [Kiritimatiellia bacterium]|nr:cytochrome c biogenesis protein CcsA [Kiritimatiellia bacterium]HMO98789.1 cytochrome c biogenesis protein CcsA [Kiritimatiellia bacterium]HMP96878.1 cytochrome c biogenesis protein CcsA [Kiritimatiellia bacterium]
MRRVGWMLVAIGLALIPARAQTPSVESMAGLPVLEGGRIMPLDSFARLKLLQFSGKSTLEGEPALAWLARLLFVPETVEASRVFLINHPEVPEALGINPGDRRRFSFAELHTGLHKIHQMAVAAYEIADDDRSPVEKEILRLYHNLQQYAELVQAFQFTIDHRDFQIGSDEVNQMLGLPPADGYSFLDVFLRASRMSDTLSRIEAKDSADWTEAEREVFRLSSLLFQWSRHHRALPIPMIPLHGHGNEDWVSPWDILAMGLATPELRQEVSLLQDAVRHYRAGRQLEFDLAVHSFERSVLKRAHPGRGIRHLGMELNYNRLDLFYRAKIIYGLAFLLGLIGIMTEWKGVRWAAVGLTALAVVPHAVGMVWRMMIMGRPPMTNLYATFVFVAFVVVLLGLIVEWFQRNNLGSVMAGFSGLALLMIADRFSTQGDTLGVVVAVLDSNFWLATHVVTITIGYAGCVAAGVAGHVYLLQALFKPEGHPALRSTSKAIYGLLAFGLIFSFLGTMLGGVWADQSWGRFWGWDPKENGALLIVLWCAVLFHARLGGMIGPRGMAAGSVLGVIIVIFAWLGVNLLGVGLHSYGFTSGLALGMWISIGIEVLFVALTAPFARRAA